MPVLPKNSSYLRVFFLFCHVFLQIHRRRVRFELCRTTNRNNNNQQQIKVISLPFRRARTVQEFVIARRVDRFDDGIVPVDDRIDRFAERFHSSPFLGQRLLTAVLLLRVFWLCILGQCTREPVLR